MQSSAANLDHLPIIQAPMAGVSSPRMAAAVSEAGGLGSIGIGSVDAKAAQAMIVELRERTQRPFNVNLFCHQPSVSNTRIETAWTARWRSEFERFGAEPPLRLHQAYRSFREDNLMLEMLLNESPPVISFHFGLPGEAAVQALRNTGAVLMATATSLSEARVLEASGVDAIVAQGWEAGGHRGVFDLDAIDDQMGTMPLTQLLVHHISLPIVAAGGIMDGVGTAAALSFGASAVQLGTAFLATNESLADVGYRAALASEAARHTVMTQVISGRPARCLANRFTMLGAGIPAQDIPAYPIAYDLAKALHAAGRSRSDFGFGAQWAGQGAPLARTMSTEQLMAALATELERAR